MTISSKVYLPAIKPDDWKVLLADPIKHWQSGYSAKTLAYCWQTSNGFPESVRRAFNKSSSSIINKAEMLIAIPEHQVQLPGGSRASQSDIFILAKSGHDLIAITVEGKVREDFGPIVKDWLKSKDEKTKKPERLKYLVARLNIADKNIDDIRYQLLHRSVSALDEAERFTSRNAMMLVHSFSQAYDHFDDYARFLSLYGIKAETDTIHGPAVVDGLNLYFGWVIGEKKYRSY